MHYVLMLFRRLFVRPGRCRCGAPGLCRYDDGPLLCAACALRAEAERHHR